MTTSSTEYTIYSHTNDESVENIDDDNKWIKTSYQSGKGRCIVSKTHIPKGTIVFTDLPYIANHSYNNNNNNDSNSSSEIPTDINDLMDHLDDYFKASNCSNSNNNCNNSSREGGGEEVEEVELLIGKRDGEGDSEMNDFNQPPSGLSESIGKLTRSDYNIVKLIGKIRSNYFGLWHNGTSQNITNYSYNPNIQNQFIWVGSGVYLKLSLFNHSCFPNCTTLVDYNTNYSYNYRSNSSSNPLMFSIVTLRDIEPNEELLITYIPLDQKVKQRKSQLKSVWFFDCNCIRCDIEERNGGEIMELYTKCCCPNKECSSGFLMPTGPSSNIGICRICKNTFDLPPSSSFSILHQSSSSRNI
eukprot:gene2849-3540_t